MRFQQSWTDLPAEEIKPESQKTVEATLQKAVDCGFHHVETARHYGSSERQIGWALPKACDPQRLLQTKVPPREDPAVFERELELSVERLGGARLDLLAIHGINLSEHLDWTIRSGLSGGGAALAKREPHRSCGFLHPRSNGPDPEGDRHRSF